MKRLLTVVLPWLLAANQSPAQGPPPQVLATPPGIPAAAPSSPADPHGGPCLDDAACFAAQDAAPCGPPGRFWVSAEYLLWWTKDAPLPVLATTSPPASLGILGRPGTRVLHGGEGADFGEQSGGRFTAGFWLNDCQTKGLEASYFFLGGRSSDFTASSGPGAGTALIARPFFDALRGTPSSEVVAFPAGVSPVVPGGLAGTLSASSRSRLQGGQLNGICNLCCGCGYRVDALAGFRYLRLDEGLTVTEEIVVGPGAQVFPDSRIGVVDRFETQNDFYGGQVGAAAYFWSGRFFANLRGTVALGSTEQAVNIFGATRVSGPAGTTVAPGGLLALPSNIGSHGRSRFSVVPEGQVNLGVQLTQAVSAFVGYTCLYWSNVARPGDQIDLRVNPTLVPTNVPAVPFRGPAVPAFTGRDSDFWAQGLSAGVVLRF